MRTKLTTNQQVAGFDRVLEALGQELIESTDDELLQAAKDLGMNPTMRGSAAFIGLKYPAMPRVSDFFDLSALHRSRLGTDRSSDALEPSKQCVTGRKKRRTPPPDDGGESESG